MYLNSTYQNHLVFNFIYKILYFSIFYFEIGPTIHWIKVSRDPLFQRIDPLYQNKDPLFESRDPLFYVSEDGSFISKWILIIFNT